MAAVDGVAEEAGHEGLALHRADEPIQHHHQLDHDTSLMRDITDPGDLTLTLALDRADEPVQHHDQLHTSLL